MGSRAGTLSATPWPCRVLILLSTALAVTTCGVAAAASGGWSGGDAATGLLLVGASVINVEVARILEGRRVVGQRPHKALSAWTYACVLLLPAAWLLLVVPAVYAHAWWRGVRPPLWKWFGSASFLVVAGLAAEVTLLAVHQSDVFATRSSPTSFLAVIASAAAFLAVETSLFYAVSRLNDRADEEWLRATLASASFYLTEAGMLATGALTALVVVLGPWFLVLLLPTYGFLQQAALHAPLRDQARTDDKTGLLRFESWRSDVVHVRPRLVSDNVPWAVAILDLDHFKRFNDQHGHLVGDQALAAVADALRKHLRKGDLISRFGGEEFAVFLPGADPVSARAVVERLRHSVAGAELPSALTISAGLASVAAGADIEVGDVLMAADRALYVGKHEGRDVTVQVSLPDLVDASTTSLAG